MKPAIVIVVRGKWFFPLGNYEKNVEYRHNSAFWRARLLKLREGDRIEFRHGYAPNAPRCTRIVMGVSIMAECEIPCNVLEELAKKKGAPAPAEARIIAVRLVYKWAEMDYQQEKCSVCHEVGDMWKCPACGLPVCDNHKDDNCLCDPCREAADEEAEEEERQAREDEE